MSRVRVPWHEHHRRREMGTLTTCNQCEHYIHTFRDCTHDGYSTRPSSRPPNVPDMMYTPPLDPTQALEIETVAHGLQRRRV